MFVGRWLALFTLLCVVACGGSLADTPAPAKAEAPPLVVAEGSVASGDVAPARWDVAPSVEIPVTESDPVLGDPYAPVTIVQFADYECPYCRKAEITLSALQEKYGPKSVRFVYKHNPLPFHARAREAAEVAAAVLRVGGNDAFWAFHRSLVRADMRGEELSESLVAAVGRAADVVPFSADALRDAIDASGAKVGDDMALAAALGARATPAFFVNGIFLSGAQPMEKFETLIDAELAAARTDLAAGTSAREIYARRIDANKDRRQTDRAPAVADVPDTRVYAVPIDGSVSLGNVAALVTLVEFADYECPFCRKVQPTLRDLRSKYGDKLRIVFKHRPLPFHQKAVLASNLMLEILKKKGDKAFWAANDAAFALSGPFTDADLELIATDAGLDAKTTLARAAKNPHAKRVDKDSALAEDLDASGVPTFFVNGRRLTGVQPPATFEALIDEELVKAQARVDGGTPPAGVYAAIVKEGVAPAAPEVKTVSAPLPGAASRGPKNAPVTVQIFSDFQCPFCKRVAPTLEALGKEFPKDVRFVFRDLPLAMHADAPLAAEAAREALRQKKSEGFWRFHDALFEALGTAPDAIGIAALERIAEEQGLDMVAFRNALMSRAHQKAVEADVKAANDAGISGTPGFVINGYFLSGAQPISKFRRAVKLALKGPAPKPKPAPAKVANP